MADTPEHRPALLPGMLQEVAEHVSIGAAITLARLWGGSRVYLCSPENLTPEHKLSRALGYKAALLLVRHFGSGHIEVPTARYYLNWYDVRVLKLAGKKPSEIGRDLKLRVDHVRVLLKGFDESKFSPAPKDVPQLCVACGRPLPHRRERKPLDSRQLDLFAASA